MRGVSRESLAAARERLDALLGSPGADASEVGQDLLAVTDVLAGSAGLRRALTDPARTGQSKAELLVRLLRGQVSSTSLDLLSGLVGARWASSGDLTDAVEGLGVEALLVSAERAGRLDSLGDELFRFSRIIAGDVGLRDALSARTEGSQRKSELVQRLLAGKAGPEATRLAVQAAVAPRGMRSEQVLERYVEAAAARRMQLVAEVVSAVPLGAGQRERLAAALERIYGRPIQINADVDPDVVGGLRVQVGGDLVDGTMLARLEGARRRLAG